MYYKTCEWITEEWTNETLRKQVGPIVSFPPTPFQIASEIVSSFGYSSLNEQT